MKNIFKEDQTNSLKNSLHMKNNDAKHNNWHWQRGVDNDND